MLAISYQLKTKAFAKKSNAFIAKN